MKRVIFLLVASALVAVAQVIYTHEHPFHFVEHADGTKTVAFKEGSFKLAFELVTNWVTLREEPTIKTNADGWRMNGPTICRQAGQVISNNVAVIVWNGVTNRVSLDSVPLDLTVLPQRTITNEPMILTTNFPPSWYYYSIPPKNAFTPL